MPRGLRFQGLRFLEPTYSSNCLEHANRAARHWANTNQDFLSVMCYRIKDKAGKRPNDPDYNPRTLLIPNAAAWVKDKKVSNNIKAVASSRRIRLTHTRCQKLYLLRSICAGSQLISWIWFTILATVLQLAHPAHHWRVQVTEAQQQWWNFKSDNFDSVLLFKVGKFYEVCGALLSPG